MSKTYPMIENKAQMIGHLADGCKPKSAWRIGTEHEKIGYSLECLKPLPYAGDTGILAMLEGLQRFDLAACRRKRIFDCA